MTKPDLENWDGYYGFYSQQHADCLHSDNEVKIGSSCHKIYCEFMDGTIKLITEQTKNEQSCTEYTDVEFLGRVKCFSKAGDLW